MFFGTCSFKSFWPFGDMVEERLFASEYFLAVFTGEY